MSAEGLKGKIVGKKSPKRNWGPRSARSPWIRRWFRTSNERSGIGARAAKTINSGRATNSQKSRGVRCSVAVLVYRYADHAAKVTAEVIVQAATSLFTLQKHWRTKTVAYSGTRRSPNSILRARPPAITWASPEYRARSLPR